MDEKTEPRKLEHQIEVAERAASTVTDQTIAQTFRAFAHELRQMLQRQLIARRRKQEIRARAFNLWDQAGRPPGRDLEFWFQAERELDHNVKTANMCDF